MTKEEIIEIRKTMGVSQERFAHMLGTTHCTVNRWERGKVKPSRLYIKEIEELKRKHGSYLCRRQET